RGRGSRAAARVAHRRVIRRATVARGARWRCTPRRWAARPRVPSFSPVAPVHAWAAASKERPDMSLRDPNVVDPQKKTRVAIVIASRGVPPPTGWPVGFWWSELAHPYYVLTEAGYEVEIASPAGGKCEADALSDPRDPSGYSASDLVSMGFLSTPRLAALVE